MRKKKLRTKIIGTYDFQGMLDITDPCYRHEVYSRINHIKVAEGSYECYVQLFRDHGENFDRVAAIGIRHNGSPVSKVNEYLGYIGVDAGLAGFFHDKPDYTDEEWDQFILDIYPPGKPYKNAWIRDEGFFCRTGVDGGYEVFASLNGDRVIDALKIWFVDPSGFLEGGQ